MEIVRRVHSMREIATQARAKGLRVGLVPTMGALHEGHLSLVRAIHEVADVVVVSVFVNPQQFGPEEDFESYPRDLTADADQCIAANVDYLFAPEAEEIFPPGPRTIVEVEDLSSRLEGASRPGHFRGVTTVVLKLFQIVRPDIAGFGQKDAQQAVIVRRMVEDLLLGVEILTLPIVRDEDGLALSSRNRKLTAEQREIALALSRVLEAARRQLAEGEREASKILEQARNELGQQDGVQVDYVELVEPDTFEPLASIDKDGLLLLAVVVGEIRLIDNAILQVDPE